MAAPAGFGPDTVFIHPDDNPRTLELLRSVAHEHDIPAALAFRHGGAYVDWAALDASHLSSTEKGSAHVARGCAVLERHGGAGRNARVLADVVIAVSGVGAVR